MKDQGHNHSAAPTTNHLLAKHLPRDIKWRRKEKTNATANSVREIEGSGTTQKCRMF